jgi:valyl-tRNA synthetase
VQFAEDGADPVATVPVPGGSVEILPSPDVDPDAAQRKRGAERARLEDEVKRAERKLSNEGFVSKAPADVVQAERDKLERLRAELEAL